MPALAESGYRVIAPDLRGFGLSDKPLNGFDVVTVSEDIPASGCATWNRGSEPGRS
jgi:pimeloyl-ACP methyl ester carboxylesterase